MGSREQVIVQIHMIQKNDLEVLCDGTGRTGGRGGEKEEKHKRE